jgi:hypothetical protein
VWQLGLIASLIWLKQPHAVLSILVHGINIGVTAAAAGGGTGNGGFLGATGTEIHVGETLPDRLPQVFPKVRLVFFCPARIDGVLYQHAVCPPELGGFSASTLMKDFNIAGWNIAEVKHPADNV